MGNWWWGIGIALFGILGATVHVVTIWRGIVRERREFEALVAHVRIEPAHVLAIEQTGRSINDQPVCRVQLRATSTPFKEWRVEQLIRLIDIPRIQVGNLLNLRVDDERGVAVIDFELRPTGEAVTAT